jgi:hypothetical protein
VNYLTEKMIAGDDHVERFIAHLRDELRLPIDDIAAILVASAGRLYREAIQDETHRQMAIIHIVETAMHGVPKPLPSAL